jgi:hypothetical protein
MNENVTAYTSSEGNSNNICLLTSRNAKPAGIRRGQTARDFFLKCYPELIDVLLHDHRADHVLLLVEDAVILERSSFRER